MKKNILITGGLGFQGVNLCKNLLLNGCNITILTTSSKRSISNLNRLNDELQHVQNSRLKVIFSSITDRNSVFKNTRGVDAIFHLASNVHVDESIKHPDRYVNTNVLGTMNVLDAAIENGNIPVIVVSSCEVYGGCDNCSKFTYCNHRLNEDCSLRPKSPYAGSKTGQDRLAYSYYCTYGLPVVVLRPFNVYGPGQRFGTRGAVIPIFVNNALRNKDITIYGDGNQTREFINVFDLVRAYRIILENVLNYNDKVIGETFNIGVGYDISINDIANNILDNIPESSSSIRHIESRAGEVSSFISDSDKIIKLTGWSPTISFNHGIKEYIKWFKDNEL